MLSAYDWVFTRAFTLPHLSSNREHATFASRFRTEERFGHSRLLQTDRLRYGEASLA